MREIWRTTRRVVGYYPRVLKLVWEASPRYTLLTVLLTVITAAVAPAQVWISKVIIDRVTDVLQASTQGIAFDWYAVLSPIVLIFVR